MLRSRRERLLSTTLLRGEGADREAEGVPGGAGGRGLGAQEQAQGVRGGVPHGQPGLQGNPVQVDPSAVSVD